MIVVDTADAFLARYSRGAEHDSELTSAASDWTRPREHPRLAILVSPSARVVEARFVRRYRHVARFRDADTPRELSPE